MWLRRGHGDRPGQRAGGVAEQRQLHGGARALAGHVLGDRDRWVADLDALEHLEDVAARRLVPAEQSSPPGVVLVDHDPADVAVEGVRRGRQDEHRGCQQRAILGGRACPCQRPCSVVFMKLSSVAYRMSNFVPSMVARSTRSGFRNSPFSMGGFAATSCVVAGAGTTNADASRPPSSRRPGCWRRPPSAPPRTAPGSPRPTWLAVRE